MNVSTAWRRAAVAGVGASMAATLLAVPATPAMAIPPPAKHVTIEFLDVRASDTEDLLPPLTPVSRPIDEFYLQGSVYSSYTSCGVGTAPVNAPLRTRRGIRAGDRVVFDHDVVVGDSVNLAVTAVDQDIAHRYDTYRENAWDIAGIVLTKLLESGRVELAFAVGVTFLVADQISHDDMDDPLGNLTVSLPVDGLTDGEQTVSWNFDGEWGGSGEYSNWDYTVRYRITVGPPTFTPTGKGLCVGPIS